MMDALPLGPGLYPKANEHTSKQYSPLQSLRVLPRLPFVMNCNQDKKAKNPQVALVNVSRQQ